MDYFQAVILAIVEGVTEFLPISSTGHLILTTKLLAIPETEFVKSFEIFIQLGAIIAVAFLYRKTLLTKLSIWKTIIFAFIPTAIIGLLFYKVVKELFLGNASITLSALFIGGIALIILEKIYKEKDHHANDIKDISIKQALMIGVCQSFSIIPGVSRAAATIIGALFLGVKRKPAVEFSFLLAIPTMAAATGLDLLKTSFTFTNQEYMLLAIGFIGSFVTALIVVKLFIRYVQTYTFIPFGIYRIILAILFFLIVK